MKPLLSLLFLFSCSQPSAQLPAESVSPDYTPFDMPQGGFMDGVMADDGSLWLVSNGNGVYHWVGQSLEQYTETDGLASNEVYTAMIDHENHLWFGTQEGLSRFDGKAFYNLSLPYQDTNTSWLQTVYPIINPNAVSALLEDEKGNLWIGTAGGGAYRYDGAEFTPVLRKEGMKYADSLHHNWITDIEQDESGSIWFASMSYGGLAQYDGEQFHTYHAEDGLSDNQIRRLYFDTQGNLWLGFNGNRNSALTQFNGETFTIYSKENNPCHRNARALCEDSEGRLWIGGNEGLCLFENGTFSSLTDSVGQSITAVNFIIRGNQQDLWIGGANGLWKYNGSLLVTMTQ